MTTKKQLLAISGSTRASSTNLNLIHAFAAMSSEVFEVNIFPTLSSLPHFNPDLDTEHAPEAIQQFRVQLTAADAVLICTPEYAMGVPGTLKNAIDWLVSSCELSGKPTALITASSVGEKGHASLLDTLHIIEAKVTTETQLLIPHAKTKINAQSIITNEPTKAKVKGVIDALYLLIG